MVENKSLEFQDLQPARISELALLFDITQILNGPGPLPRNLQQILKVLAQSMGMRRGTVTILNPGDRGIADRGGPRPHRRGPPPGALQAGGRHHRPGGGDRRARGGPPGEPGAPLSKPDPLPGHPGEGRTLLPVRAHQDQLQDHRGPVGGQTATGTWTWTGTSGCSPSSPPSSPRRSTTCCSSTGRKNASRTRT